MQKQYNFFKKALQVVVLLATPFITFAQCNLFFSEYLEGASNNKAVEVYNPTLLPVDLTEYKIYRYNNGSLIPTDSLKMVGMLAPGGVYVAGNPSAVAAILTASDTLHTITFFNGNDALELRYMPTNTSLDIIGIIGNNPGTFWPVGTGSTLDFTLVRKINISQGTLNWAQSVTEWDVYPQNTTTFIGNHTSNGCCTATTSMISATNCDSYTSPSGQNWTISGTYMDTIANAVGCDSVITVNLTIHNSSTNSIVTTVCGSYTSPSGLIWTTSGTYMDTISNVIGCDSVITVDLTVNNSSTSTIAAMACDTYTSPSGMIWTTSGTYMDTIPNAMGCDSVITVNLAINNTSSTISPAACDTYTSPSGQIWTMSGTYMDTIPNMMGCDSVVTINLTINTVDATVDAFGTPVLYANAVGANYQWVDCNNGYAPMLGETNQSFIAPVSGDYAVIVSQNGCVDTSICNTTFVGVVELEFGNEFSIYPNPTTGQFQLELGASYNENLTVEIKNAIGQVVENKMVVSSNQTTLNIEGSAGVYFVEIRNEAGETANLKIVKK